MTLRIGELFAGYGGLGEGVKSVLGGEYAWFVEYDSAPSKILAHWWPSVPNYGDITKVDWSHVEPVDILTGGSPCQDLSHAGARRGMTEGTRSNLWVSMREAIAHLRPSLVVWENVRGAYSAEADSGLERCPRCVGNPRDGGAVLRALGRVLGDLADLGYDAQWVGVRAADAGAPHGRFRVFVFAWPAADAGSERHGRGQDGRRLGPVDSEDAEGPRQRERAREVAGDRGSAAAAHADLPGREGSEPTGGRHLPARSTATAADADGDGLARIRREQPVQRDTDGRGGPDVTWGDYEPAIRRWERLTRPAPAPTEPGKNGQPRLSPAFVEWLMGLPAGHVTDPAIGLTRNEQLKALGNGVVPQQAALATRTWLHTQTVRSAA